MADLGLDGWGDEEWVMPVFPIWRTAVLSRVREVHRLPVDGTVHEWRSECPCGPICVPLDIPLQGLWLHIEHQRQG